MNKSLTAEKKIFDIFGLPQKSKQLLKIVVYLFINLFVMKTLYFTREELAHYILYNAKESFIEKIRLIMEKEDDEIVAHTVKGKPLTQKEYLEEVLKGKQSIERGDYKTSDEVKRISAAWGK